jgi:peptide/nickel transport system permease protein
MTRALESVSTDYREPGGTFAGGLLKFVRSQPLGSLGGLFLLAMVVIAIFGGRIAPYTYDEFNIPNRFAGPSLDHPFGTDGQGRDVFSRVLYGTQTSLIVGFAAVTVASLVATAIGAASGYYRGITDLVLQRFVDFWLAFPGLIFIIFVVAIFGTSIEMLILTLGLLYAARLSRVVRSAALQVSSQTYVEAAKAIGAGDARIMMRHVIPNILPVVIINASVTIGAVIIAEAALSFLGFGTPPPFPSWGRMLKEAQQDMLYHPNLALFPGLAIALTVYSFNMLGDAIRDWLDPRLRART